MGSGFRCRRTCGPFWVKRLCDVGRASLEKAEAEFRDYCQIFVAGYRPLEKKIALPKSERPKPVCDHGKLLSRSCPECERERDRVAKLK